MFVGRALNRKGHTQCGHFFVIFVVPVLLVVTGGCSRPAAAPSVTGSSAGNGWEIRYMSALSLARRGSEKFSDPVVQELMLEMLDEQQQIRNARQVIDGREVADLSSAGGTVFGALDALAEHHRRRPSANLAAFLPAIEKLTSSGNASLQKKAKSVREQLAK